MNLSEKNYSPAHNEYLKTIKRKDRFIVIMRIVVLIAIIDLWEIAARLNWIDAFIMSSPSRILNTAIKLFTEDNLSWHLFVTVSETVAGFLIGTIGGVIIAIILWWSNTVAKISEPYLVVLNALPKIALGPVIIVWVGAGYKAIIAITVLISIIVTILSMLNGFMEVSESKIKLMETFSATKLQILQKVILPASIPTMISTLKINVGMAWVGVIVGEFLVSKDGLGYLIVYGGQVFKLDLVMTSVIILSIAAGLMYAFVAWLEKKYVKI